MGRNILERMGVESVIAVRCAGSEWPSGVFSETLVPDGWMGLLERRDGRRRLIPAGDAPRAEASDTILLIRNRLFAVPLAAADAVAAGGHDVQAQVELLVRVPARDHELAAFSRTFVASAGELQSATFAERFTSAGGRVALLSFVAAQSSAALLSADQRGPLLAHLREKLRDFLFESGFEIESVTAAEFRSAAHARELVRRRESASALAAIQAREMVEQAAVAATQRKLEDLSGVFSKLRAAADKCDGAWHKLLPALSPIERGRLLKNLWRLTPDLSVAREIIAVAGNQVLWIDPASPLTPRNALTLPPDLGALRSVTHHPVLGLLIGAATGFWRLQSQTAEIIGRIAPPASAARPTTGFNGAAIFGDWLVATHSQLGAWAWSVADLAGAPQQLIDPAAANARTIRSATTSANQLLIAVDDCVHSFDQALRPGRSWNVGGAAIHDLAVAGDYVYVSTARGMVMRDRLDGAQDVWEVLYRDSMPLESLCVRQWHDLTEIVVAAGARGVIGIYPDQEVTTPLLETPAPVRRAWLSDDAIVALSELRDRLFVLHAPTGGLAVEVPLSRRLSASVQDVVIVTDARPPVLSPAPAAAMGSGN